MINKKIIALASLTDNYGLNDRKKYQGSSKNNICGDKIEIQLDIKNKVIKSFRYETESCIFCQASANLLAKSIIKRNISSIKNDIIKISNGLKNKKVVLPNKFKNYKDLINDKYTGRLNCIALPFNTILKILKFK